MNSFQWLNTAKFLQKEKSQKIIEYLKKGYTNNEISKILRCSPTKIQKVKGMVVGWNDYFWIQIINYYEKYHFFNPFGSDIS